MQHFKILIITILLLLICPIQGQATADIPYIKVVEQNIFNTEYQNESIESRLNRIEINIFGNINTMPAEKRVEKLKQALGSFNTYNATKTISPDKYTPIQELQSNSTSNYTVKYPVIDEIESKLLSRVYTNEDIYKRLERLEIIVFKQTYNISLSDRVDNLRNIVLGSPNNQNYQQDLSNKSTPDESLGLILSRLEKETFNQIFSNDTIDSRISRLENKVFQQTSPELSQEERTERLASVVSAQPTNQLYQDMSAIRQYQAVGKGLTVATLVLMIIKGFFF